MRHLTGQPYDTSPVNCSYMKQSYYEYLIRNRHGEIVDPIPFVVITGSTWLLCLSFGPLYLDLFGIPWTEGLLACVILAVVTSLWAYRRFIWTVDPAVQESLSAGVRFHRLCLGGIAFCMILIILAFIAAVMIA
jgi:hypothetical protein